MSTVPNRQALPKQCDPRKLAAQHELLLCVVPVTDLPRFASTLEDLQGEVSVHLQFSIDEEYRTLITGNLETTVTVQCQRCLGPMTIDLSAEVSVCVLMTDEQAQQLPSWLDPWLVPEESAELAELIEEELLLAMPIVATHDDPNCAGSLTYGEDLTDDDAKGPKSDSPFDKLAALKGKL